MLILTEDNWADVIFGPSPEDTTPQKDTSCVIERGGDLTPDEQAAYEMWLLAKYGQEMEEDF